MRRLVARVIRPRFMARCRPCRDDCLLAERGRRSLVRMLLHSSKQRRLNCNTPGNAYLLDYLPVQRRRYKEIIKRLKRLLETERRNLRQVCHGIENDPAVCFTPTSFSQRPFYCAALLQPLTDSRKNPGVPHAVRSIGYAPLACVIDLFVSGEATFNIFHPFAGGFRSAIVSKELLRST